MRLISSALLTFCSADCYSDLERLYRQHLPKGAECSTLQGNIRKALALASLRCKMETYGSLELPTLCNPENDVSYSLLDCEQRMPPWMFAAFVEEHTHFTDLCNIWLTEIHHQEQQQRLNLIKGHSTAVLHSLELQAESVMQVLETQTAAQATLETTLVSVTRQICEALVPYDTLRAQLLSIIEVLASFSRSTTLAWTRARTLLFHVVSVGVLFLGLRLGKLRPVVLKGLAAQSVVLAVDIFLTCSNVPLMEMAFEGVKISVLLSVADLFDNVMMPLPDSSLHHSLSDAAGTINQVLLDLDSPLKVISPESSPRKAYISSPSESLC